MGALNRSISLKTALKVFAVYIIQRVCRRYASKKYHRTLSKLEKTAVILQKFFRTIRFRKKLAEIRLFAQSSNINMLTDSLVNGISVISYSEIKPNEVKASEVFLRLVRFTKFQIFFNHYCKFLLKIYSFFLKVSCQSPQHVKMCFICI